MAGVFDRLGVPVILNAAGTLSRLSGAPMRPEVAAAMAEAAGACVEMQTLQAAASERIAAATGAEAGCVTAGASAALLVGAASCMAGLSPAGMSRLPDGSGARREIVMIRSHRNSYDVALRVAGARIVEVGLPDRASGAGVRDADLFEIEAAIGERTAAIHYVARPDAEPALTEVAALARRLGLPVLVDAAAQIPPARNLRRFIEDGADLVAFSGGKAIGGPSGSGILCGRKDLVAGALLQQLDLDVSWPLWRPPAALIDKAALGGVPRHGVGRASKLGREQVVGLLTALELFLAETDAARHGRWLAIVQAIEAGLTPPPGARLARVGWENVETVPRLELRLPDAAAARRLVLALEDGAPPVCVDQSDVASGVIRFNPICLAVDDAPKLAEAVTRAL